MKKIVAILLLVVLLFSLCGCVVTKDVIDSTVNIKAKEKDFKHNDFTITLTSDFLTMDFIDEDYDFIWGTEHVTVMGMFVELESDVLSNTTAHDYANAFCEAADGFEPSPVEDLDGIPITKYVSENDGNQYKYMVSFYEATTGMWGVIFCAEPDYFDKNYAELCKYAKSVKCNP